MKYRIKEVKIEGYDKYSYFYPQFKLLGMWWKFPDSHWAGSVVFSKIEEAKEFITSKIKASKTTNTTEYHYIEEK